MIVVRRSLIVFFISISLISVSVFILSITENYIIVGNQRSDIFSLFFETVSAFGTVGLSRGITPFLSEIGKFVLIVVMFFGRVGLFTLAIAIGEEKYHTKYKYPETNIMVG
jgi:trk system potassium uptake protein TrkH